MWLIRLALRRPITIMVVVVAIALSSILAVLRTRIDIFPTLDLPVIYVAQPFARRGTKHTDHARRVGRP